MNEPGPRTPTSPHGMVPHPPVPHVQWPGFFPIASLHPYSLPRRYVGM